MQLSSTFLGTLLLPHAHMAVVEEVHRGGQTSLVQLLAMVDERICRWPQKVIEQKVYLGGELFAKGKTCTLGSNVGNLPKQRLC